MKTGVASVGGTGKKIIGCALAAFLSLLLSPARGDAVSDWNAIAVRMAASSPPSRAAHELAAVRVAMFETMNFIEGKYVPRFLVEQPTRLGASGEVEAIGAAHYVLTQLYPGQELALDAALERSLAAFPDRETSRARIWGKNLGRSVYVAFAPGRPANGVEVQTNAKLLPLLTSPGESRTSGQTWDSIAIQSIEDRTLQPIERARIYALVSLAVSEAYRTADRANAARGTAVPCISCAAGAAIRVVLKTEFGSAGESASRAYSMPVLDDAGASRSARLRDDLDASKISEAMGVKIGLRTLTYYRRTR
jgi:hypothetical protein